MLRVFHPIGQGAFYTEFFNNFTMVYDCGSSTDESLLKNEIKSTFEKGEKIDAVFISHLHTDHVNGLEFLLNYCNVRRLFLPLMSDIERIQLIIHNSINFGINKFVEGLIFYPEETLSNSDTQLFFIPPVEGENLDDIDKLSSMNFDEISEKRLKRNILDSNIKLKSRKTKNWIFLPFNFQDSKRSQILQQELANRNIFINSKDDFEKNWSKPKCRKSIIDSYKSVPGNFNTNSLTLYSGPEFGHRYDFSFINACVMVRICFSNHCFFPTDSGCLYFGDYEAKGKNKWTKLHDRYHQYWPQIGTVQIPHHGSKHNYNRKINKKPMISIISAGNSNIHRHPHPSTIRDIVKDNGWPVIVNENAGSRVQFYINGI